MYRSLHKKSEGFTIIEVLIVLAIAGLIMLIVFLAVPALQRNSRNTQRRNDVSRILSAITETAANRNWDTAGWSGLLILNDSTANMGDLSIYQDKTWTTGNLQYGTVGAAAPTDLNHVAVVLNAACSGETTTVAKNRSVAVVYLVETGGGTQPQCESN